MGFGYNAHELPRSEETIVVGQWLGILGVAIALYILWQIRQIVLLIFTAIVLATAINGLVKMGMARFKLPRQRAILLVLGVLLIGGILFIALVVPPFINQFQELIQLIPRALQKAWLSIPRWIDWLLTRLPGTLGEARQSLLILKAQIQAGNDFTLNLSRLDISQISQQASPIVSRFVENFFSVFNNAIAATLQVLLILILTLMLLVNPSAYRACVVLLFPSFYRRRADAILTRCQESLENWFFGIFISSLFVGSLSGIGLWILGIDLALAHALLAGLLNFIPNIGPGLSVVFPLVVAIQTPSWKILAVIILYVIVQQVESYWVTPTIMAHQVSLLPALTLMAQICFTSLFGLSGLILALPLAVVSKVWLEECLVHDILDRWDHP